MAQAAAKFTNQLLKAYNGEEGIVECAYVKSNVTELEYFASPIELGPGGVKEIHSIPSGISDFEKQGLEELMGTLGKNIEDGNVGELKLRS